MIYSAGSLKKLLNIILPYQGLDKMILDHKFQVDQSLPASTGHVSKTFSLYQNTYEAHLQQ